MLSKTAEYALRAAVCLAQPPGEPMSAQRIAEVTHVPRRYLHKVLQGLVGAKLVTSQPGPGGGYSLAMPVDEMTILDVIDAVDPIARITHCPLGLKSHTRLCPLHRELDEAYAAMQKAFGSVTLEQVIRSSSKIIPLHEVELPG